MGSVMNLLKKENGGGGGGKGGGGPSELAPPEVASLNFSVEMEKWAKSPVSLVHRWQKYLG